MKKSNFKAGLFIENNQTYLSLEYIENNMKVEIHKIGLNDIDITKERVQPTVQTKAGFVRFDPCDSYAISFPIFSTGKENIIYTITDLNKVPKEMSIKDIEKQLGYSIKIKGE